MVGNKNTTKMAVLEALRVIRMELTDNTLQIGDSQRKQNVFACIREKAEREPEWDDRFTTIQRDVIQLRFTLEPPAYILKREQDVRPIGAEGGTAITAGTV